MRTIKTVLSTAVAFGLFGLVMSAEIGMAQSGAFTVQDAYAQMGGMSFEMAELLIPAPKHS